MRPILQFGIEIWISILQINRAKLNSNLFILFKFSGFLREIWILNILYSEIVIKFTMNILKEDSRSREIQVWYLG